MIKIGLTGGIGSGKTIVATLLNTMGIPVYIADEESKRLTESSPIIREKLITLFGPNLYTSEGLNKKLLASYIFNDADRLKQVNAIIHPEVQAHFISWTASLSTDICAIETAILFESGFDRLVDVRMMVYAPLDVRIERAVGRGNVSCDEVVRRINSQMPDEEKKALSDYIICNDGHKALIPQLEQFLSTLRSDSSIF